MLPDHHALEQGFTESHLQYFTGSVVYAQQQARLAPIDSCRSVLEEDCMSVDTAALEQGRTNTNTTSMCCDTEADSRASVAGHVMNTCPGVGTSNAAGDISGQTRNTGAGCGAGAGGSSHNSQKDPSASPISNAAAPITSAAFEGDVGARSAGSESEDLLHEAAAPADLLALVASCNGSDLSACITGISDSVEFFAMAQVCALHANRQRLNFSQLQSNYYAVSVLVLY